MSQAWKEAKEKRAEMIHGKYCEICGTRCNIIGHHIYNRHYKKPQYEVPELCELRCVEDEKMCHEVYKDGNRPEDVEKLRKYLETH